MGKIVYLPLDERPCNAKFPMQIAASSDLKLTAPPRSLLGNKKQPAPYGALKDWLIAETVQADILIISLDMLVYGGIVPSRLHHLSGRECSERFGTLIECRKRNPWLRIYAFNLIMRAPACNSSDEEPDYYEEFGVRLARNGWLSDKTIREGLSDEERLELQQIRSELPETVTRDFIGRRETNTTVNHMAVDLVRQGAIDFLIIPLDDNAKYGYSSHEQRQLLLSAEKHQLLDRIHIYPGADEIGCTLLARVFCELKNYRPEIYIRHSSTNGPFVIPKYEDRSLGESIKSHITAAGAFIADSSAAADAILMVNSPPAGQYDMAETSQSFSERHASYFSEVNLREFAQAIDVYTEKGKMVALADVGTCNGADEPLMKLISKSGLLPRISAYAGWNTSGNTLGTVIAHAIIESFYRKAEVVLQQEASRSRRSREFYLARLVEDWGYQSIIRREVARDYLEALGGNYFDISAAASQVHELIRGKMNAFITQYLHDLQPDRIKLGRVELPWRRMFEVDFELSII
ncbi:DUF4127 family protein [Paenibacillus sp. sptzw28]|uniref:DUF4127 family protein n=1 Tax=Paenibacillus sp. sptzw28 TaxID=715179 RepID=UPI001C6F17E3|nr:DUF4127 family protein [Paenibacillus sp. sptzw28]QYR23609.1 DUF4127 family protein [Paenibacillus sp. sptzw28]